MYVGAGKGGGLMLHLGQSSISPLHLLKFENEITLESIPGTNQY